MRSRKFLLAVFPWIWLQSVQGWVPCQSCNISGTGPKTSARIIGHYYNWKSGIAIAGINGSLFTHIIWDGVNVVNGQCAIQDFSRETLLAYGANAIGDDSGLSFKGQLGQLVLLKSKYPHLKTVMTIGGYNTLDFSTLAASNDSRMLLANSCISLAERYNFDGVEVRWLFPGDNLNPNAVRSAADRDNHVSLLKAFRDGNCGLLVAELPIFANQVTKSFNVAEIAPYVSWVNVMAFGMWGIWSNQNSHCAPLFWNPAAPSTQCVDFLVTQVIQSGMPPCKISLAFSLSYPAWILPNSQSGASFPGLFVSTGATPYTTGALDLGQFRYRDVADLTLNGLPWALVHDDIANASALFNAVHRYFISIESPRSLMAKASYAHRLNLGGVYFHDLSGDKPNFEAVDLVGKTLSTLTTCQSKIPTPVPIQVSVPGPCRSCNSSGPQSSTRIIGHYRGSMESLASIRSINGSQFTHIVYSQAVSDGLYQCQPQQPTVDVDQVFGPNSLGDDTDSPYKGNYNQLRLLKLKYPHLKTILQVGQSVAFSTITSNSVRQSMFVDSCIALMKTYGFDGINVYWEYPMLGGNSGGDIRTLTERDNFNGLAAEFRVKMGSSYILTADVQYTLNEFAPRYDIPGLASHVDWINVRSYSFWGRWAPSIGHASPLYFNMDSAATDSVKFVIERILATGIPSCQVAMSIPLIGIGWTLSSTPSSVSFPALFQKFPGTYLIGASDNDMYRYRDIVSLLDSGWVQVWDNTSKASFLYGSSPGAVISYDSPAAASEKISFSRSKHLGGIVFTELDGDTAVYSFINGAVDSIQTSFQCAAPTSKYTTAKPTTRRDSTTFISHSSLSTSLSSSPSSITASSSSSAPTSSSPSSSAPPPASSATPSSPMAHSASSTKPTVPPKISAKISVVGDLSRYQGSIILRGVVSDSTLISSVQWVSDRIDLNNPEIVPSSRNSLELEIVTSYLINNPGRFNFSLILTPKDRSLPVFVVENIMDISSPLHGGQLYVSPASGVALHNAFTLSTNNWVGESVNRSYARYFIKLGSQYYALGDGQLFPMNGSSSFTTVLPIGDPLSNYQLVLAVEVIANGIPSTTRPEFIITCTPPSINSIAIGAINTIDGVYSAASIINNNPAAQTTQRQQLLDVLTTLSNTSSEDTSDRITSMAKALSVITMNGVPVDDRFANTTLRLARSFLSKSSIDNNGLSDDGRRYISTAISAVMPTKSFSISSSGSTFARYDQDVDHVLQQLATSKLSAQSAGGCGSCSSNIDTNLFTIQTYRTDAFSGQSHCPQSPCRIAVPLSFTDLHYGMPLGIVSIVYRNISCGPDCDGTKGAGWVHTVNIMSENNTLVHADNLHQSINISMGVVSFPNDYDCAWFSQSNNLSLDGCQISTKSYGSETYVECQCRHLTDFVLVHRSSLSNSSTHMLVLSLAGSAIAAVVISALSIHICSFGTGYMNNKISQQSFVGITSIIVIKSILRFMFNLTIINDGPVSVEIQVLRIILASLVQFSHFVIFAYFLCILLALLSSIASMCGWAKSARVIFWRAITTVRLVTFIASCGPITLLFLSFFFESTIFEVIASFLMFTLMLSLGALIPSVGWALSIHLHMQAHSTACKPSDSARYNTLATFLQRLTMLLGILLLMQSFLWIWSIISPSYGNNLDVFNLVFLSIDIGTSALALIYQYHVAIVQYTKFHAQSDSMRLPAHGEKRQRRRTMVESAWERVIFELANTVLSGIRNSPRSSGSINRPIVDKGSGSTAPTAGRVSVSQIQQRDATVDHAGIKFEAMTDRITEQDSEELALNKADSMVFKQDMGDGYIMASIDGRTGIVHHSLVRVHSSTTSIPSNFSNTN
uniref:GH18 domain-containing protein n=1 Tax=Spongospora subterranea TaxID=70186 RepID=A0A0H5QTU0_9EUKA|eukprot:CRZ05295.1 hypothetical protein [Spongospora subterranea]